METPPTARLPTLPLEQLPHPAEISTPILLRYSPIPSIFLLCLPPHLRALQLALFLCPCIDLLDILCRGKANVPIHAVLRISWPVLSA